MTAEPLITTSASVSADKLTASLAASNSLRKGIPVRQEALSTSMTRTSERSEHPILVVDSDMENKEGLHVRIR